MKRKVIDERINEIKIAVHNSTQSEKVQNKLFELGAAWDDDSNQIKRLNSRYLFVDNYGSISIDKGNKKYFDTHEYSEVYVDDLLDMEPQSNRFTDTGKTIIDNSTGLEWLKDWTLFDEMDWNRANKLEILFDWGLPSKADFQSLNINNQKNGYPLKSDLEEIGFRNVGKIYWTSEEFTLDNTLDNAWIVGLISGHDDDSDKTNAYYVTLVRDIK